MKKDLVSIITPLYNAEDFIAKTIESVRNQTYTNWEMLIVDDCSTDQSAQIVKQYVERDERIHYIRLDQNVGVAQARNEAIECANGRYLAFLDSDDLWKQDKLYCQIAFMKKNSIAFSYTACSVIDENGKNAGKVRNVPAEVTYQELLKGNVIPCLTVVLDKEQMMDVRMPRIHHEDYATWLNILKAGVTAYGIKDVLAEYRVRGKSVSANKLQSVGWTFDIYRKYLGFSFGKSCWLLLNYLLAAVRKRV